MGSIYKFVTRAVLHNSIVFMQVVFSFLNKHRKSITYNLLALVIVVTLTVVFGNSIDDNLFSVGEVVIFTLLIVFDFVLFLNLVWSIFEANDDWSGYKFEDCEPKFTKWIGRGIGDFCKEVARSDDEQEEVDKKRKKEIKEKRLEIKRKKSEDKRLILEMKNAEKNKFNRFEAMEIE